MWNSLTSSIQFQHHCYNCTGTFSGTGVEMYYTGPKEQTLLTGYIPNFVHLTATKHIAHLKKTQRSDFQNSRTATAPMLGCHRFSFAVEEDIPTRPAVGPSWLAASLLLLRLNLPHVPAPWQPHSVSQKEDTPELHNVTGWLYSTVKAWFSGK